MCEWIDYNWKSLLVQLLIIANDRLDVIVAHADLTFSLSVSLSFKMDFYTLPRVSFFLTCPHCMKYLQYVGWDVFE